MRPQLLFAALTVLASASCYSPGDGQAPPLDSIYFPTGLALDTSNPTEPPRYLYVASSDFDLKYRSSSLLAYDLDEMRKAIPRTCAVQSDCQGGDNCDATPNAANGYNASFFCVASDGPLAGLPCGGLPNRPGYEQLLNPGRCDSVQPGPLIHSTVGIGAFATDVIFQAHEPTPRLFLPVRGDATLHWIDLHDGKFDCDQQSTDDGSCAPSHRSGDDPAVTNNNLRLAPEPFAIAATQTGDYVALTNQTSGSVALFANDWGPGGPQLVSVLGGLPQAPVAIVAVPDANPTLAGAFPQLPGFLVAYRNAAQVDLLRVHNEPSDGASAAASYTRYALTYAGSAAIGTNSLGFDSRDIVIDDSQRQEDYQACGDDHDCLLRAHQANIYVANRAPSSLLVGAMTADFSYATGTNDLPSFSDPVPLTTGPSRVVLGKVKVPSHDSTDPADDHGQYALETRVFVVCFDSRRIFVYDPKRHVIEAIVGTGRGPYALAVDELRGLAYVAHFTDSYLGVVSLDQRFPQTYAAIVASIGTPSPPRTSK